MFQVYNVDESLDVIDPLHATYNDTAYHDTDHNDTPYNSAPYNDTPYNDSNSYNTRTTDSGSLANLRQSAHAMHDQRRLILCILLSIHVDPFDPAWGVWRGVVSEVHGLVRILGDFTRELKRCLENEQGNIPSPIVSSPFFHLGSSSCHSLLDISAPFYSFLYCPC